jgi:hypothetical protein
MRTAPAALLSALLVLGALTPAAADDEAPPEADLIRRGVEAREQGRDQDALALFRQAFERYHTPRAQAQLGLAAQALGRWREADDHLRAALASQDAWIANNRAVLEQALSVVGRHVGSLDVLANVNGAELSVDGRAVGKLPLSAPLRLAAGTSQVEVRAPGYTSVRRPVTVLAGELGRETFELVALPSAPPVAPPEPPPPSFVSAAAPAPEPPPSALASRWTFVAAAVATAAVGGAALWSGLDTLSARDKYVAAPTEAGYKDGLSRQRRTNWLLGGTAVLGTATAALGLFVTRW